MDFDYKKPSHLFALLLILVTFAFIIVMPYLSFFGIISSTQTTSDIGNLSESVFFQEERTGRPSLSYSVLEMILCLSCDSTFLVMLNTPP